MDQHNSQLAHHILELAPQLAPSLLLVIDEPFRTLVLPHETWFNCAELTSAREPMGRQAIKQRYPPPISLTVRCFEDLSHRR